MKMLLADGDSTARNINAVMAGQREARSSLEVPAIHVLAASKKDVDARDKPWAS
jgi:hypothetical protein